MIPLPFHIFFTVRLVPLARYLNILFSVGPVFPAIHFPAFFYIFVTPRLDTRLNCFGIASIIRGVLFGLFRAQALQA